ncbi:hypothetical protein LSAT2_017164, partial [Lamellibrachia satsuma]
VSKGNLATCARHETPRASPDVFHRVPLQRVFGMRRLERHRTSFIAFPYN